MDSFGLRKHTFFFNSMIISGSVDYHVIQINTRRSHSNIWITLLFLIKKKSFKHTWTKDLTFHNSVSPS